MWLGGRLFCFTLFYYYYYNYYLTIFYLQLEAAEVRCGGRPLVFFVILLISISLLSFVPFNFLCSARCGFGLVWVSLYFNITISLFVRLCAVDAATCGRGVDCYVFTSFYF